MNRRPMNLTDERKELFARALAAGLDAGRYLLVADPGQPDADARIIHGPYFDQKPVLIESADGRPVADTAWAQAQIDENAQPERV